MALTHFGVKCAHLCVLDRTLILQLNLTAAVGLKTLCGKIASFWMDVIAIVLHELESPHLF